jgi:hypothetical protein
VRNIPTGYVAIHVIEAITPINFTPDMQLIVQGQFDNISRSFALSARYRSEYEPGNEIFAAIGQSAVIPGTTFEPQTRSSPCAWATPSGSSGLR